MENTQKTPETLTPEQMESGKWYVVDDFLIKFEKIEEERIYRYKSFDLECKLNFSNIRDGFLCIKNHSKIRYATKEEVLKYFPDEVFEPIELRPEDLVSGEVYKKVCDKFFYIFQHKNTSDFIYYTKMINHNGNRFNNHKMLISGEYYHATHEEKKLLLGEEETIDWETKYNELKSRYEVLVTEAHKLDVLSGEMCDKFTELKAKYEKLSAYNDELTERINQTEIKNNQGKVYFCFSEQMDHFYYHKELEGALSLSCNDMKIYEAICIGKKKSVLVNETT